ncbi:uncharacterized protein K452DRAFT_16639 [Aplosporella prunicola CBS 121167]|uniref:Secreted protein n=1 Tax=Aplosporella prunicola CBS 121167 TaxID=1176127 RepID=A0A6A6AY11_9PEZI|nr:uncharacterized protein K452DRAFT_16639 [Aplosporella prunicola CBS 121167]KAF2135451.1 hypothetical protein K452DRAFT_16639 [Aplosporella prunicola CBS 121167]
MWRIARHVTCALVCFGVLHFPCPHSNIPSLPPFQMPTANGLFVASQPWCLRDLVFGGESSSSRRLLGFGLALSCCCFCCCCLSHRQHALIVAVFVLQRRRRACPTLEEEERTNKSRLLAAPPVALGLTRIALLSNAMYPSVCLSVHVGVEASSSGLQKSLLQKVTLVHFAQPPMSSSL